MCLYVYKVKKKMQRDGQLSEPSNMAINRHFVTIHHLSSCPRAAPSETSSLNPDAGLASSGVWAPEETVNHELEAPSVPCHPFYVLWQ